VFEHASITLAWSCGHFKIVAVIIEGNGRVANAIRSPNFIHMDEKIDAIDFAGQTCNYVFTNVEMPSVPT
jgi:hypothetical protein